MPKLNLTPRAGDYIRPDEWNGGNPLETNEHGGWKLRSVSYPKLAFNVQVQITGRTLVHRGVGLGGPGVRVRLLFDVGDGHGVGEGTVTGAWLYLTPARAREFYLKQQLERDGEENCDGSSDLGGGIKEARE